MISKGKVNTFMFKKWENETFITLKLREIRWFFYFLKMFMLTRCEKIVDDATCKLASLFICSEMV